MSGIKIVKSPVNKNGIQAPKPADTEAGNLDQIRNILFGAQVRQYDQQFLQLKAQLAEEVKQIRREMVAQIEAIKKLLGQTSADMIERLNVEKQQRTKSQSHLSATFQETSKALQSRIDQGEQNIRALMETQLSGLRKDMDEQHRDAVVSTEKMIADLKSKKANSEDLSILFSEVSSRLSGAPKDRAASTTTDKNA